MPKGKNPVLYRSERLYLSPLSVEHAEYFMKWFNDPEIFGHLREREGAIRRVARARHREKPAFALRPSRPASEGCADRRERRACRGARPAETARPGSHPADESAPRARPAIRRQRHGKRTRPPGRPTRSRRRNGDSSVAPQNAKAARRWSTRLAPAGNSAPHRPPPVGVRRNASPRSARSKP